MVLALVIGFCGCSTASTPRAHDAPPDPDAILVSYQRFGGFVPTDAEALTVTAAGVFELRRTVGSDRIGQFAGSLDRKHLRVLQGAAKRITEDYQSSQPVASESVTERLSVSSANATIASHAKLPSRWSELLDIIRADVEQLTASPHAALELLVQREPGNQLRGKLQQLGDASVRFAGTAIVIEVTTFDRSNRLRARWSSTDTLQIAEAQSGWTQDLRLSRSDAVAQRTDTVIVTAKLTIVDADGIARRSQLTVAKP